MMIRQKHWLHSDFLRENLYHIISFFSQTKLTNLKSLMGIKDSFEINIPSDTSEGQKIQLRIIDLLKDNDYSDRDLFGMRLALEEALVNAIKHGNKLSATKEVNVICEVHENHVKVVITDEGKGFKLQDIPDPTEEENLEKPCGRGIMLMKAYMTSVEYNAQGNSVTFIKNRTDD